MTATAVGFGIPGGAVEHQATTARVALALAVRNVRNIRRLPATFVPSLVMPVFFVVAFSGQFSQVTNIPGFGAENILSWYTPMAVMMGSTFGGAATAQATATEIETGFMDRLLLAPAPRVALLLGSIGAGMTRSTMAFVVVVAVGLAGGAAVPGGLLGILILWFTGMAMSGAATMWGLGLVYRIKSQNAAPLVQVGMFMGLYLSTAQVPIQVMTGWLHAIARVNPVSNVLRLARSGFIAEVPWDLVWPGLVALAGMWAVLGLFALTGLRRLVP